MSTPDSSSIVICIGNELVADDAVGFEVFNRLGQINARLEYCSVGGIDMLQLLNGEENMVVVDAVQFGATPGTIHVIPWDSLPVNGSTAISAHGLGLRETVEIGRILYPDKMPEHITLIGVEGCCYNLPRENMTRAVADAIETTVFKVKEIVQGGNYG
jgi:hydrogenase maturation protease